MSNPSFKDGLLKIGKSDRHPRERKTELETTGVPHPFTLEYYVQVNDHHSLEMQVHRKLDKYRSSSTREFFLISAPKAIDAIRELAEPAKSAETVLWKDPVEVERETRQREEKQHKIRESQEKKEKERLIRERMNILKQDLTSIISQTRENLSGDLYKFHHLEPDYVAIACVLSFFGYPLAMIALFAAGLHPGVVHSILLTIVGFVIFACTQKNKECAKKQESHLAQWDNLVSSHVSSIDKRVDEIGRILVKDPSWRHTMPAYERTERESLHKVMTEKRENFINKVKRQAL